MSATAELVRSGQEAKKLLEHPPLVIGERGQKIDRDALLAYENRDLVARYKKKLGLTDEEADQLFTDTKRFLYLCAVSDKSLSPPPQVDDGWHHFLMFTEDYQDFCAKYVGFFIHHCPFRIGSKPAGAGQMRRAVQYAKEVFGDLSENWHIGTKAVSQCDGSGDSDGGGDTDGCGCNGCD